MALRLSLSSDHNGASTNESIPETTMIERTVGFIGGGVMGTALLGGMLKAGAASAERLFAGDSSSARREVLAELIGDHALGDNTALVRQCDVVVLSVKPHIVPVVAAEIAGEVTTDHLVVCIAAGVTIGALREMLGTDRVVRVMPNTPALVGLGAAAYAAGPGATDEDAALVEEMLGAVGICVRVEEEQMDAVTGLSGSGPAYIYEAIDALTDGGVASGLPREAAALLAAQTVLGAAKMVLETGRAPGELRDEVTTPGGTTVEGLRALDEAGFRQALIDAVAAATAKSKLLGG